VRHLTQGLDIQKFILA